MAEASGLPEGIVQRIGEILYQTTNHSFANRERPYDGQPHTDQGERGKTLLAGVTFRDLCDAFVIGWLQANGKQGIVDSPDATYNDIYEHGGECSIDPLAAMQCMSVELEKRMGIYPNVPKLRASSDREQA